MSKEVTIGDRTIGGKAFAFIGGPCVIEGRDITLRIAGRLVDLTSRMGIPFIFKASYDKANRTSVANFRGPGIEEGLEILGAVRENFNVPVLTDVHSPQEAVIAAEVVDVLQVPALLSRQTDLLVACGKTGKPVNIKKGQFMSPYQMRYAIGKVESTGNTDIVVTERGTSFGYNNLVNDFRAFPIMREFGYPLVFDATHSVQLPGGAGGVSAGERRFVFPLARAAIAVGADAIFMEVHEDPAKALCDGPNSVPLDDLPAMLDALKRIREAL
jgi:2-dehydro-3-deoxyphosphooctonate aldolase (KDO 8-P synthase)